MRGQAENQANVKFSHKKYYSFRNKINTKFSEKFYSDNICQGKEFNIYNFLTKKESDSSFYA